MKENQSIASERGFTAIEVVMAVAIIILMGVVTSRFLLATTRSIVHSNQNQKVRALAGMVYEQYNSYVAVNYQVLQVYDKPQPVSPSVFFGTADNLGFDGMKVSSRVEYAANHSTCSIAIGITYNQEGRLETKTFSKFYAEVAPLQGGGAVEVWVRPCDTCAGYRDFKISAPPEIGNTPILALTDTNGHAILHGVKISTSVVISAEKLPGGWGGWPNLPFVQGYYAPNGTGGYIMTVTHTVAILRSGVNQTTFSEFLPFGKVTGHLKNISTLPAAEKPTYGMAIVFFGWVGFSDYDWGTRISQCGPDRRCYFYTDPSGNFTINNVVPGTVNIAVEGTSPNYMNAWSTGESLPEVQPTLPGGAPNPDFKWGFVGSPFYNTIILNAAAPPAKPDPPLAFLQGTAETNNDIELTINRKGWFDVNVTRSGSGVPLGGAAVSGSINKGAWNEDYYPHIATSEATGHIRLYNMYDPGLYPTPLYYKFSATRDADALYPYLYHPWIYWNCGSANCMDQSNPVSLPLDTAYTLQGHLQEVSLAPLGNIAVKLTGQYGSTLYADADPATGNFSLPGFVPEFFGPDASGNPTWVTLKFSKPLSTPFQATLQGSMIDSVTGKLIPVNGISLATGTITTSAHYLPSPHDTIPASGTDGLFNIQVSLPAWSATSQPGLATTCDPATRTCTLINPVSVNFQMTEIDLKQNPVNLGWDGAYSLVVAAGPPNLGINWNMVLAAQPIRGKITGSDGTTPMPNIHVDGLMAVADDYLRCHDSDSSGNYVADALIEGRYSGSPGTMKSIMVPAFRTDLVRQYLSNVPVPVWTGALSPAFLAGEGFFEMDFHIYTIYEGGPGGGGGGGNI